MASRFDRRDPGTDPLYCDGLGRFHRLIVCPRCRFEGNPWEDFACDPSGSITGNGADEYACPTCQHLFDEGDLDSGTGRQPDAMPDAPEQAWSGHPDPDDPDHFWIDDVTGERVNATTGEREPIP